MRRARAESVLSSHLYLHSSPLFARSFALLAPLRSRLSSDEGKSLARKSSGRVCFCLPERCDKGHEQDARFSSDCWWIIARRFALAERERKSKFPAPNGFLMLCNILSSELMRRSNEKRRSQKKRNKTNITASRRWVNHQSARHGNDIIYFPCWIIHSRQRNTCCFFLRGAGTWKIRLIDT